VRGFITAAVLGLVIPAVASNAGTLQPLSIPSAALGEDRQIDVYTPTEYDVTTRAYPVVYVLHGCVCDLAPGTTYDWIYWTYFGLKTYLDDAIATGAIQPTIVVTMDACAGDFCGSYYTNSELYGNFENYVVEDVVGYVDDHFRTIADRPFRLLLGHSMGGYGAMRLALRHPDRFGAAGSCAGALDMDASSMLAQWPLIEGEVDPDELGTPYDYDPADGQMSMVYFARSGAFSPNLDHPPHLVDFPFTELGDVDLEVLPRWQANNLATFAEELVGAGAVRPCLWFDCGEHDELLERPLNGAFAAALDALGIPYVYEHHEGGHNPPRWDAAFPYLLGPDEATGCALVGVGEPGTAPPVAFRAFPSPSSGAVDLAFHLANPGEVQILVHDVAGREVRRCPSGAAPRERTP